VDGPNGGKRQTPEQNRLLSALEAFYYCIIVLLGGDDVNFMNEQAGGRPQPAVSLRQAADPGGKGRGGGEEGAEGGEEAAAEGGGGARKVQRVVKQTLDDMVAQLVEEGRVQRKKEQTNKRAVVEDRVQRRKEQTNKRAAEERWHKDIHGLNGALQAENKRRQSGRWHKNYYGQWEKWTERQ
jgi:hypothetical protein